MTFVLGLTGSIGMGKSTTAQMFRDEGVPVWDADAAVHSLYGAGGAAVRRIGALLPNAITGDAVDRDKLRAIVAEDSSALAQIEAIVHPLVAADRSAFVSTHREQQTPVILLDIPLLFEVGSDQAMDAIVVVSAPADTQRKRVLERGTMSEDQFEVILTKQIPDAEKRTRADYVIETTSLETARAAVQSVLADICGKAHA